MCKSDIQNLGPPANRRKYVFVIKVGVHGIYFLKVASKNKHRDKKKCTKILAWAFSSGSSQPLWLS